MDSAINQTQLSFSPESLKLLNGILGFVMFGIALELKLFDFKRILEDKRSAMVGLTSQLILLPFLTFLLASGLLAANLIIPSFALGMILVAACPGGNMSNFISSIAKGNIALSVTLTAVVTLLAVFMTPFNFTFWADMNPVTAQMLASIKIGFWEMFFTVLVLLALPLALGMLFNHYFPKITKVIIKPIKIVSLLIFIVFIIGALYFNFDVFKDFILLLAPVVFLHNAVGLVSAYSFAKIFKLQESDCRSVAIETGIQNTGLALVIIFSFFQGSPAIGGMACIAAWYGVWHLISGLLLAWYWSNKNETA